jgi:hypothetical protein
MIRAISHAPRYLERHPIIRPKAPREQLDLLGLGFDSTGGADLTILDDRDLTEIQVHVQRDRPHDYRLLRLARLDGRRGGQNDTDGFALEAQPDKSQGRPPKSPGSTRPSSKNRPAQHAFSLKAPVPVAGP